MTTLRAFTMPKWGIEMVEGTIGEWTVEEGEPVAKGQTVVNIETDKIVNSVEAEFATRFVRIVAATGSTLKVGALLGVMADGEVAAAEIDAFIATFGGVSAGDASTGVGVSTTGAAASAGPTARAPVPFDGAVSPAARAFAQQSALDLGRVTGSGRKGRISFQDVFQASRPVRSVGGGTAVAVLPTTESVARFYASPAAACLAVARGVDLSTIRGTGPRGRISRRDLVPAMKIVRMSPMRKAIARQLSLSKSTVPHFYLRTEASVDALLEWRAQQKLCVESVPGLNDYLVKAAALALMAVPAVNIQVHGDEIRQFAGADIAIAVATDRGLLTPVLQAVESKTVTQVAGELRPLIERARTGALRAHEIEGGSFTVSNLGMFGVEQFDAIINIPQAAILAIGAVRRVCVERASGVGFSSVATLSLSCDHRAIDGVVGSEFLATLRRYIASPASL